MNTQESELWGLEPAQVPAGFEPHVVAKISAALAALRAQRRMLTARRRCEGGRYG